jgi:hypothetical protein
MAGAGGQGYRYVTFSEVLLSSSSWSYDGNPDPEGFVTYTYQSVENGSTTITITRSDGKVLSFNAPNDQYKVQMRENVIKFRAGAGDPSAEPFQ